MSEEVKTETAPVTPEAEAPRDESLEKAREAERTRYTREETLRRDLAEKERKLEAIKKNGWDIDILEKKAAGETIKIEPDSRKEIEELKREMQVERTRRLEMEEFQSIVDFAHKSEDYELIRQTDAFKYVQMAMKEHYQNTGKYLSVRDACDYIEGEIEKNAKGSFEKISKTKKADKIYGGLSKSAPAAKTAPTSNKVQERTAPTEDPPEFKTITRLNSREAFNYFRKKHGC